MPIAQPLVGAAYQDSPGEQKGITTMPCVWRDKEGDSDQHTSYETGQNSTPMCVEQLPCARHSLGCFIEKLLLSPAAGILGHHRYSHLTHEEAEVFKKNRSGVIQLGSGHMSGVIVDCVSELTGPFVTLFSPAVGRALTGAVHALRDPTASPAAGRLSVWCNVGLLPPGRVGRR